MQWVHEELLTLAQASKLIPGRTGRGVAISTIWRWISYGRKGVKLQSLVIGAARYVTRQSLKRFVAELNSRSDVATTTSATEAETEHQRVVEQQLDDVGI